MKKNQQVDEIQLQADINQFKKQKEVKSMNKLQNPELKFPPSEMQETHSESDRELKIEQISGQDVSKIRQKINWKLLLNNQVSFNAKYVLLELLQSEKHFDLYLAMMLSSKQRVIVKIVDKQAIRKSLQNQNIKTQQRQYHQFLRKLTIQTYAQNKLYNKASGIFLIKCIEVFENADCHIKVSQNYRDTTLQAIINKRESLPVQEALAILKQLIFALAELHKEGIILTELNPALIAHKNGVFRICDFSSMRKVSQRFSSTLNIYHSYSYANLIAPQIVVCPEMVDIKSQIWALGILFYQMIAHGIPYDERATHIIKQAKAHHIMFQMKTGQVSEEVLTFMRQLLQTAPDERISWKKLINHPIFSHKEYFYSPKMMPIVDARNTSLKRKENDIIPEEIINHQFHRLQKINYTISKIKQLNIKNAFHEVEESKKINIGKFIDIENQTYLNIKQINLMALKSKYIFQEILQKIENHGLINKKRRSHIETMFMISQRCYQYIRKSRVFEGQSQDPRIDNYQEQLKQLFNRVKQFTQKYEKQFSLMNSSTYYVSNDLFSSIVSKKKHQEKEKFIKGQEGFDFTTQEHVKYTQEKCVNKILTEIKGEYLIVQYVVLNLESYEAINKITLKDIEGKYTFSEVVNNIINPSKK